MTVLEHLGGAAERRIDGFAAQWSDDTVADLNLIAIECRAEPSTPRLSRLAGLPDTAFEHDGQLTKRDVRAITLARLAPTPGELLWDVGAGSGSIGIEWMRAHPSCRALAIEADEGRQRLIERNRDTLGVPGLQLIRGKAPRRWRTWSGRTRCSSVAASPAKACSTPAGPNSSLAVGSSPTP